MSAAKLSDLALSALASTSYPPRPGEKIQWDKPLFDSDGYEHALAILGSAEVVTKYSFVYAIWDRKTGECKRQDCEQMTIGNTQVSEAERAQRFQAAMAVIDRERGELSAAAAPHLTESSAAGASVQPAQQEEGASPKFFLTAYRLEVLSEDKPLDDHISLAELAYEIGEGPCVGRNKVAEVIQLSGKQAADALYEFGSEPGFFQLNDDGTAMGDEPEAAPEAQDSNRPTCGG